MRRFVFLSVLLLVLTGCGRNMYEQARFEEDEPSTFFADGTSSQPLPDGVVSRSRGGIDEAFFTGQDANGLLAEPPLEITQEVLERGQERYNIYCSPCHNYSGDGQGMIVQKGFVQPASFHEERLQASPVGYFFNVITNGYGRMYSYGSRVPPEDRWAIASYIKALQYSQTAPIADLPVEVRGRLSSAPQDGQAGSNGETAQVAAPAEGADE